jgi:hypothetical protein
MHRVIAYVDGFNLYHGLRDKMVETLLLAEHAENGRANAQT